MEKTWDVAIIGAGAAGLMAAIHARREGCGVLLLDGKDKIGAKILMSGGTRCNITNQSVKETDFETESPRLLGRILKAFPSERAVQFFEELGLSLVLEPGGKYFPATHSGRTVLDAFLKELERTGVELQTGRKILEVAFRDKNFCVSGEGFSCTAKCVILTTGGLSFPATGSDGTGYKIARSFGHQLIETTPSLTPLETTDSEWTALSGLSLPARLSLWISGKKKEVYEGDFLFTHFGFSGPVVLDISRHWIRKPKGHHAKIVANFMPGLDEDTFREKMAAAAAAQPHGAVSKFMSQYVPARFAEVILKKAGVRPDTVLNQLPRLARESLIRFVRHCPLNVTGDRGYDKAEVTAGGVPLKEINPGTMESGKQPGLFLAGEILDVDGRIGGFNFQWAWSSGYVAACGAKKYVKGKS